MATSLVQNRASESFARVETRAGDASDADEKVARAQQDYDIGALNWTEVDASGTPEQTLKRARHVLNPFP